MNLTATVQRAKDAASKAKPFMRLMDALSDLDRDLREAAALETNAEATAKRKADLEASFPALESQAKALQNTVNSLKSEISSKRTEFNKELEDIGKAAEKALADKHAKAEADHQAKITGLKNEVSKLASTVLLLENQKAEIEAQIAAIRKTFESARSALHV